MSINLNTATDIQKLLATQCKALRLQKNYKRLTLSQRSGVPEPTLRRFETTGEISLRQFLMLVQALGQLSVFENCLKPPLKNIAALVALEAAEHRSRGRE